MVEGEVEVGGGVKGVVVVKREMAVMVYWVGDLRSSVMMAVPTLPRAFLGV